MPANCGVLACLNSLPRLDELLRVVLALEEDFGGRAVRLVAGATDRVDLNYRCLFQ